MNIFNVILSLFILFIFTVVWLIHDNTHRLDSFNIRDQFHSTSIHKLPVVTETLAVTREPFPALSTRTNRAFESCAFYYITWFDLFMTLFINDIILICELSEGNLVLTAAVKKIKIISKPL